MSEWLKVMLEEIARKKAEIDLARADPAVAVVIQSDRCAGDKNSAGDDDIGDAAPCRDQGRGRAGT